MFVVFFLIGRLSVALLTLSTLLALGKAQTSCLALAVALLQCCSSLKGISIP